MTRDELIEKLARAWCADDGADPDLRISTDRPVALPSGLWVMPEKTIPMWRIHVERAKSALNALAGFTIPAPGEDQNIIEGIEREAKEAATKPTWQERMGLR